ncbi:hypothetical protein BpHYR1_023419 [Brachionus plicatilis]|uniref:Uncharacterized protein n=1 Tax=Brachionus plicatilis TaxID=10195 RepID=A0A3M7QZW5_BRAPC|nr:hypothetical protein BpHYR1_023419 [Brachionus plicatilis]
MTLNYLYQTKIYEYNLKNTVHLSEVKLTSKLKLFSSLFYQNASLMLLLNYINNIYKAITVRVFVERRIGLNKCKF